MSDKDSRGTLDDLTARLARARGEGRSDGSQNRSILRAPTSGLGLGLRIGVELVAALIVGVGIGLLLDRWLGTTPWFLVLFLFLGSAAGVLNVYRAASGLGLAAGYRAPEDEHATEDSDHKDGSA